MNEKFYALLEYLEMINHWEMVYGKGTENDRKTVIRPPVAVSIIL